jgi:hypothetical protein
MILDEYNEDRIFNLNIINIIIIIMKKIIFGKISELYL